MRARKVAKGGRDARIISPISGRQLTDGENKNVRSNKVPLAFRPSQSNLHTNAGLGGCHQRG